MNCRECDARIDPDAICVNCGLVDGGEIVQEDIYEQNSRLRECLEKLASRHVKSKPLWWQKLARDALTPKEGRANE